MDAAKGLLVLFVAATFTLPSVAFGQSGWSGGTSAPSTQAMYDRYGQPIAQRAQTAVSETGSALSDSFNAGVKAAESSIKNWSNQSSASTGAPSWANTQPAAPAAPSWPSSQPDAASAVRAASPISTNGGWSSITSVAAPPLLVPNSPMSTPNFGSISGSSLGASFTSTASNDTTPLHSVLKDPASSPPNTTNTASTGQGTDWSAGWAGDNSAAGNASIGRTGNASTPASNPRYAGTTPGNSWSGNDSWAQTQQPALGAATGPTPVSSPNTMPSFANSQPGQVANQTVPQFTGQQAAQNPATSTAGNYANYTPTGANSAPANGYPNQQNQMNPGMPGMNQYGNRTGAGAIEAPQWMPLILSVMGLAASLAANLYLGVSYLDARQKYQSLVRKTAETFRRVKAVAA